MKIKGSVKSLKINYAFIIFAVGTALALGVRIFQAFSGIIDFDTGFYTETHVTTPILYLILAFTGIGIFLVSFLSWEIPQEKMPEKRSIPVAIFSVAFAGTLVYDAIIQIKSFLSSLNATHSIVMGESQSVLSQLTKSGALPRLGEGVFAIISAVFFLITFFDFVGLKKVNFSKLRILTVAPLFWATLRMVQRFTRTISFMNVSSLLLELFMIAFMMMFFMYFAQMASEVNNSAISFKVFAYGLIAAMFSAVVSIPKVLLIIFDGDYRAMMEWNMVECPLEVTDVAFAGFAVLFLVLCLSSPRIRNMTAKETEKLIEEK